MSHLQAKEPNRATAEILVVLNRFRDGTAAKVAAFAEVRTVVTEQRNVGAARGLGTTAALARRPRLDRTWTAHTDADSTVPVHWLSAQLALAQVGFDVVLGTVTPTNEIDAATLAWDRLHIPSDERSNAFAITFADLLPAAETY